MRLTELEIEIYKEDYPKGTRVRCVHMSDSIHPVPSGTLGTVEFVDDIGQIHVKWDNGSSLALVPYEDTFSREKV